MKKDLTLISALVFSAIWHIFWLSVFVVVVVPKNAKTVKFSNVSFLGQILDRGILNVNLKVREETILERRYLAAIEELPVKISEKRGQDDYVKAGIDDALLSEAEIDLADLIAAAIENQKIEPGRDIA